MAVLLYRLAHGAVDRGPLGRFISRILALVNILITGADFHSRAQIGPGLFVPHSQGTMFGEHVRAGKNLTLYAGVLLGQGTEENTGPLIGDDVTFWSRSSAFGTITIGDHAQIGAHAMLMIDVPAGHSAVGVPARVLPQPPRPV